MSIFEIFLPPESRIIPRDMKAGSALPTSAAIKESAVEAEPRAQRGDSGLCVCACGGGGAICMNSAHNERQLLKAEKGWKIRLHRGGAVTMVNDQLTARFPVASLPRDTHTLRSQDYPAGLVLLAGNVRQQNASNAQQSGHHNGSVLPSEADLASLEDGAGGQEEGRR